MDINISDNVTNALWDFIMTKELRYCYRIKMVNVGKSKLLKYRKSMNVFDLKCGTKQIKIIVSIINIIDTLR